MSTPTEELALLRSENEMLKALLAKHGIDLPLKKSKPIHLDQSRTCQLSSEAKVKLFRQLFRGRDDVYPVR